MKTTKSILIAALILPFMMAACSREEDPYSTSAAPTTPDRTMETAPPAAGMPPSQPAPAPAAPTPSPTPSPDAATPGSQPAPPAEGDAPAAAPTPAEEPRR